MTKRALIVVDIQNDYFAGGRCPLVGIDAAADNAARAIAAARDAGDLVVHIRHEFRSADAPFFAPGSEGARTHPKAQSQDSETVIVKHFPNAFRDTGLKALLDEGGIEEVTIVGAMSHMCVDAATRAACDFGYKVTVVHDACATRDLTFNEVTVPAAQVHAAFMAALASSYAKVISTADHLAATAVPTARRA
jgi:nicotinamidase-related amidase